MKKQPPVDAKNTKPKRPISAAMKRMHGSRQTPAVRRVLERARKDGIVV